MTDPDESPTQDRTTPAGSPGGGIPPSDWSTPPTSALPRIPERIGSYKILSVRGEGGMGTVYVAEQEHPIRRRVALKVIKLGMDTKEVITRFQAERQALALMDHPNIAKVFDAGATEDGRPYFSMELVQGEPITAYCDRQKLTTRERLDLFIPACQAIHHAHQKGVIHRDVKPSNILVAIQDGKPVPKVIDFGVAKATNYRLTERTLFTEIGRMIGTPEYMSPEQAEMSGLDVDTQTDVYSLGVVLYELLTGVLPFDPRTLRKAGFDEIRRVIREVDPPKPSTRISTVGDHATDLALHRRTQPRQLCTQLRGDLDCITMRSIEKDRTRRYASASELARDIKHYLSGEPVSAAPPSQLYTLKALVRRHRTLFASLAFILLTAIVGFAVSFSLYLRSEHSLQIAEWRSYLSGIRAAALYLDDDKPVNARAALLGCPVSYRNWEWRYLLATSDASRGVFVGLGESPALIAQDPRGHLAATTADGSRIWTWDTRSGAVVDSVVLPARAFPSDVRSFLKSIGILDTHRIRQRPTFDKTTQTLLYARGDTLCLSPRSPTAPSTTLFDPTMTQPRVCKPGAFGADFLVTAYGGLWSVSRGGTGLDMLYSSLGDSIDGEPDPWVSSTAVGECGLVVFGTPRGRLFSGRIAPDDALAPGNILWSRPILLRRNVHDMEFVRDRPPGRNSTLAVACDDGVIRLIEMPSGNTVGELHGHHGDVLCLAVDMSRALLASGGRDGTVRLWSTSEDREIALLRGHEDEVCTLAFLPSEGLLASGSSDGTVRLWNVPALPLQGVRDMAVHPDGRVTAIVTYEDSLLVLSTVDWRPREATQYVGVPSVYPHQIAAVVFAGNEDRLCLAGSTGTLGVWSVSRSSYTWTTSRRSTGSHSRSCAYIPKGDAILIDRFDGGAKESLLVCSASDGGAQGSLPGSRVFALTRNSDRLAIADGNRISVWNHGEHVLIDTLAVERDSVWNGVRCLEYSPSGRYLAAGFDDCQARIFDTVRREEVSSLIGHARSVVSLGINDDETRVVTGSADGEARVWDLESGEGLLTLPIRAEHVSHVEFLPGSEVLLCVADGVLYRFLTPSE